MATEEMQAGDVRSAVIHLKTALQKDPQLFSARRALGNAYLIVGLGTGAEKELRRVVESDVALPDDIHGLVRALILQEKYQEALELLPKDGGTVAELILKGDARRGLKDHILATRLYDQAIAKDATASDAYKGKARLAWFDGGVNKMAENISKALKHAPKDIEIWLMKGLLATYQKQIPEALEAYDTALTVSRHNISRHVLDTRSAAARLLLDNKQPDKAKAHIDAIGEINIQGPIYKHLDARFNYQKGNLDTAFSELQDVIRMLPNHGRSLLLLGAMERERGNLGQSREYLARALSVQPNSLYTRQLLGLVYISLEQYPEAIAILEPVVRALPNEAFTWTLLGNAYIKSGNLDGATRALTRASVLIPESADVRGQLALSYLAVGENDAALKELHKAIEAEPDNEQAGYLLATTLLREKDYPAALVAAEQLSKKHPDNAAPLNLMGSAFIGLGDLKSAAGMFTKAVELDPKYITPALNLIKLHLRAGRVKEAVRGYENILIKRPFNSAALVGLAKILLSDGKVSEAIERLQQARMHNPGDFHSRLLLANLNFQQGRNSEALQIAKEALSLQPEDARSLLLQSRVQLSLGEFVEARTSVSKILELNPEFTPALYQLAIVNIRKGELKAGLGVLQKLLKLSPQDAGAKIALSNLELRMGVASGKKLSSQSSYQTVQSTSVVDDLNQVRSLLSQGKLDGALKISKKSVEKSPKNINALVLLGSVYRAKNDYASAKQAFGRILSLNPSSNVAALNLAGLSVQEGDREAARAQFSEVLKRDPSHVEANIGLAKLSNDEQALELLQRFREVRPDTFEPILLLAKLHAKKGQWREAISLAQAGLKRAPNNITLLRIMSSALVITGDFENASRLADHLLKLTPNSAKALLIRGEIRTLQKSYDLGREDLRKASKLQPDNPRVGIMLASLEINAGRLGKAIAILQAVLNKQPDIAAAWTLMGKANWQLKNARQAVENYRQADKLLHSTNNIINLAKANWLIGNKALGKELLRKWLNSKPDNAEVHTALGDMLMVEKKWSIASREYEQVLKTQSNNASVMNKLASAYANQSDDRAESMLEAAYKLDDQAPDILDAYGSLLVKKEQFQKGINVLRRAVSLEKQVVSPADRATTRFHLAEAYRLSGNINAAVGELKVLLSTGISFPEKDRAKSALSGLQ